MSTPIQHHPDSATLMSFAAATLAEPLAAVVASHVSMCPHCRAELADIELLGAELMLSPHGQSPGRPLALPPRPAEGIRSASPPRAPGEMLPRPLVSAYALSFDGIPWRRLGPGVWHHRLTLSEGEKGDLRLLKISRGRAMPDHGHGGAELTLVLTGSYRDETGVYRRGDIQDIDEDTEHRPIADDDAGCICLIASERPARFKGIIGRLIQPLTGM